MTTNPDHRLTHADLTVRGADGAPLAHAEVRLSLTRQLFKFGCTSPDIDNPAEVESWLGLFNTATLPLFYWGRFEPEPGRPRTAEVRRVAEALAARGVELKGHPLVWHTVKAPWVDRLPLDEVESAIRSRIRREVDDFAGLIDTWDVINEVVIMPRFNNEPDGVANTISQLCREKGRLEMVRMVFDEARGRGTNPLLLINDFNLSAEYEQLIEELLGAGVQIDAIGLQSHMHQGFRGEEFLLDVCDRFARFGLPLHWTETTLVSGDLMPGHIDDLNDWVVDHWPSTPDGEQRQADEISRHFSTLYGHPAVEAVTYWGFADGQMWLNAPGGFVHEDGTAKPSYHALEDLIRGKWWTQPQPLRTDADGRLRVDGVAGTYRLEASDGAAEVELGRGPVTAEVAMDTLAHGAARSGGRTSSMVPRTT